VHVCERASARDDGDVDGVLYMRLSRLTKRESVYRGALSVKDKKWIRKKATEA